ncbi:hypothetical protein J2T25_002559 [Citrobacter amalonaticus]|uniref:tail fiber assembly protein n=1 Tax=Citrobacter amalonaticus TaxID=35703 RepID=UPI00209D950B|nr:tail fiber assembly protein [Citrobacter amalonaticus]MCP1629608.1 hypothetical protein [Citrobacter amalonaticus]
MTTIYYSAIYNAFYPEDLKDRYKLSNTWPKDAKEVDLAVFEEFALSIAPEGKIRAPNEKGLPSWREKPPRSIADTIYADEVKKASLIAEASKKIEPLQDAEDLQMATESESKMLLAWKKYRVMVNRITPDGVSPIEWPEEPTE